MKGFVLVTLAAMAIACNGFLIVSHQADEAVENLFEDFMDNGKVFKDDDNDAARAVCTLPALTGRCRGRFPKWFSDSGVCKQFVYGGCGGNGNRFNTKTECEKACKKSSASAVCTLPALTGRCRGRFPKWFSDSGVYKQFVYGGCGGNGNRFNTKTECEKACKKSSASGVCGKPLVSGHCRARFPKWGYSSGVCKIFYYGGCGGNKNRFNSKVECERTCKPTLRG